MTTICETKTESINGLRTDIGKNNDFYVYHLIDPRSNLPFYVGKGKNYRMYRHESNVINGKIPNGSNRILFRKIKEILDSGLRVKYSKIVKDILNEESKRIEINEISRLSNEGVFLCNVSPGGDDRPPSEYVSKRHSMLMKGHKVSEETRQKMSRSWWRNRGTDYTDYARSQAYKTGFNIFWKGKTKSEEDRRKYSLSKLGSKNPMFKVISDEMFDYMIKLHINGTSYRNIKIEVKKKFDFVISPNKIGKEFRERHRPC
jgi:hypothetical protein